MSSSQRFNHRHRAPRRSGAPDWVVTYADLMSLLLCFFILLQVFSEVKKDDEYQRVVSGVREAFGYEGGPGRSPVEGPALSSIEEGLDTTGRRAVRVGPARDEGLADLNIPSTRIHEGIMFTIGGAAAFDAESAYLTPSMRADVMKLGTLLAGRRNRIIIRGHAANKRLSPDSPWTDLNELSYARARETMDILVESGIEERYCRIEAAGRWEPLAESGREAMSSPAERRVDIILTDELIEGASSPSDTEPNHALSQ